jgi:methanogenic corrinoid protein MtbC1
MVVPVLERIGAGWEEGRVSLSQVYMSGRLCEELMDALRPVRSSPLAPTAGLAIAILEDYHSLGMKLVSSALRSGGLEALDYGRMEVGELVERAGEDGTRVLLVSVLMLRSALRVRDLRSGLEAAGLDVRLGVGGAPFRLDAGLWKEVGADGTAGTASGALDLTRRLLAETAA